MVREHREGQKGVSFYVLSCPHPVPALRPGPTPWISTSRGIWAVGEPKMKLEPRLSLSETLGLNVRLFPEPRLFWSRGLSVGSADEWVCAQPVFLTSLVAQTVKRLPTMRETRVQSLGWEDPLEKEMATHSSTLAWTTPWTEERGRLQFMGSQRIRHD